MMFLTKLFLGTAFSLGVFASPINPRNETKQWDFAEIPPSKDLVWYPCSGMFFCAMLDVPLDYTDPGLGRAYVPVIKNPATTNPYKGIVLTNPGGPGGSGTSWLDYIAELGTTIIGSNYDLVSWDPRGVNNSIPSANCNISPDFSPSPSQVLRRGLDKLDGPRSSQFFYQSSYDLAQEVADQCAASIGGPKDAGPHMTTATVTRDMISIIDAFKDSKEGIECGDKGLLNYSGVSYGTFLGQTFASMFPNRVGRMILDGVLDAEDWVTYTNRNLVNDADDTFSTFFLYCHLAGPTLCSFYTVNTPHDIYQRFETLVNQLDPNLAWSQNWANATAIEVLLSGMKSLLFAFSYLPILAFPAVANTLLLIENIAPNVTLDKVEKLEQQLGLSTTAGLLDQWAWRQAITCTDVGDVVRGDSLESFGERNREFERQSWVGGEGRAADRFPCAVWNISSDDRFTGPFGGKTKNPILFVSNTLDPITPHRNGRKGTRIFKDAQLLTIEGTGHSAEATQNKCAYAKFYTFFQTGKLPGKDNYCALEAGPWNITIPGPLVGRGDLGDVKRSLGGLRSGLVSR